jgi:hypothetical protein
MRRRSSTGGPPRSTGAASWCAGQAQRTPIYPLSVHICRPSGAAAHETVCLCACWLPNCMVESICQPADAGKATGWAQEAIALLEEQAGNGSI